jgi:hypothetical protein
MKGEIGLLEIEELFVRDTSRICAEC